MRLGPLLRTRRRTPLLQRRMRQQEDLRFRPNHVVASPLQDSIPRPPLLFRLRTRTLSTRCDSHPTRECHVVDPTFTGGWDRRTSGSAPLFHGAAACSPEGSRNQKQFACVFAEPLPSHEIPPGSGAPPPSLRPGGPPTLQPADRPAPASVSRCRKRVCIQMSKKRRTRSTNRGQ